jgi:hypothetical protein
MATGSVSAIDTDNWQLIETKTISSSTSSINFTGLAGAYKNLMMAWNVSGDNYYLTMRINGDTDNNYSGAAPTTDGLGASNQTKTLIWLANSTGSTNVGYVVWTNCNSTDMPKIITKGWNTLAPIGGGIYWSFSVVDSIQLQNAGNNISSGTVKLYGQAV